MEGSYNSYGLVIITSMAGHSLAQLNVGIVPDLQSQIISVKNLRLMERQSTM